MKILVIGTGYVGTTTALVFAEMGWKVTGLDTDSRKLNQLKQGILYFHEPGLTELLQKHNQLGNINFTSDKKEAIENNDVIFICVGTPSRADGSADLTYVKQVAQDIGQHMNGYKLIVNKSTVPVGTQEKVTEWITETQQGYPFDVASNPEFLREGKALEDSLNPDRIVIGTTNDAAAKQLRTLYSSMKCEPIETTPRTAELIKYASNAFLATKISFMNELSRLSDKLGVNIKDVAEGMGYDTRIGAKFLQAGIGYGGSCFPKDVAALVHKAEEEGMELQILKQVMSVNETQYLYLLDKAKAQLGDFSGKKVAVLGLAFKPDTDDIREAPSLRLIQQLMDHHATVHLFDPIAKLPAESKYDKVNIAQAPEDVFNDADAVFICTEWPIFKGIDWMMLHSHMKQPNIFDGRNMLDAQMMKSLGYYYQGIGYK
ncbi:UDP-glucose dehydrogenase family protein [Paenibacillus provencensis]|uniref:UDP-glucose 6-dehydrogenase n=1 Tax=Paenibacillus provencensis TaxID=441151 RepID=A0ABW3PRG4_9BACL|nr:UDP-glucose/GDP-mannose dehydrogenase family protein [Paenibacillus sp. MER 78]MCM3129560.1 UDP-glucose/GDP-mannose dehydrogenase family protein [Paenibacillus sp. MER 78]